MNTTQSLAGARRATSHLRTVLLAITVIAAFCLVAAGSASAAATLNVSTDSHAAGSATGLTINTALSGWGYDTVQYGAQITLPPALGIAFPAYGTFAQECPSSAYSTLNTGLTLTAQAFSNADCPAEAKVGTATLGSASGSIYWVAVSPIPQLGVYFDTGVATPYGRRLNITYNGSTPTLRITGLPKTSTNGLTLTFNNPSRPTLPGKIWVFTTGDNPDCVPSPSVTGNVWTWPYFGTTATSTAMTPKTLSITGCGISFKATTDTSAAGASTALTLSTPLSGTGYDTNEYGATMTLPPALRIAFPAYGSYAQECPPTDYSALSTGITPGAQAFSNAGCPAEANIGTATLGSASGSIYWVGVSPIPQLGVYFDTGVATPYGRRLDISYNGSTPTLRIMGLPNSSSSGLTLSFNNPSRPTLPSKVWLIAPPGDPNCYSTYANATVFTWPASGTAATQTSQLWSWMNFTGC